MAKHRRKRATAETVCRAIKHLSGWEIAHDRIRRTYNIGETGPWEDCPITSACFKLTGKRFSAGNVEKAAKEMGLPDNTTTSLVDAADKSTLNLHTRTTRRYRHMLLEATGLCPPSRKASEG